LLGQKLGFAGRWVQAVGGAFVPWILAAALFGEAPIASIVSAGLVTMVRGALVDRGRLSTSRSALVWADLCQLVAVGVLIAVKQPLPAAALGIVLAAQVLLQIGPREVAAERRLARVQVLATVGAVLVGWTLGR
jgi:hypothetical protein